MTHALDVGDHAVLFGSVRRVVQTADIPLLYGLRQFSVWHPPVAAGR